jgi:photosystem II stability/assembly factor-like uncharacterized protein
VNTIPKTWNGPIGGTITSIIFDPHETNKVYLASWNGGVYRSEDYGQSWSQINNGLPTDAINTLAIDPNNPSVLYAGPFKFGLYKSTDGGASWTNISKGMVPDAVAYSIVIDPSNSNNVYASTRDPNINGLNPPWKGTLYKSTDGGATWTPSLVNAGGTNEQDWVYSLAIDPHSSNIIFAAAHETGIYRSTNAGSSWQRINTGLTDLTGRSILIDPTRTSTEYVGFWHRSGAFKSTDSGDHWSSIASGIAGTKVYHMTMDPNNPAVLYAATYDDGLYKSTNAGGSWRTIGFRNVPFVCITVHPVDSSYVLAGAAGTGLWLSEDGGANWRQVQWGFTNTGKLTSSSAPAIPFGDLPGME